MLSFKHRRAAHLLLPPAIFHAHAQPDSRRERLENSHSNALIGEQVQAAIFDCLSFTHCGVTKRHADVYALERGLPVGHG